MHLNCATPEDVLKSINDKDVQMVDLRFTDLPGVWQHFSVPPSAIDPAALKEGIGFDGSSIRGYQESKGFTLTLGERQVRTNGEQAVYCSCRSVSMTSRARTGQSSQRAIAVVGSS